MSDGTQDGFVVLSTDGARVDGAGDARHSKHNTPPPPPPPTVPGAAASHHTLPPTLPPPTAPPSLRVDESGDTLCTTGSEDGKQDAAGAGSEDGGVTQGCDATPALVDAETSKALTDTVVALSEQRQALLGSLQQLASQLWGKVSSTEEVCRCTRMFSVSRDSVTFVSVCAFPGPSRVDCRGGTSDTGQQGEGGADGEAVPSPCT